MNTDDGNKVYNPVNEATFSTFDSLRYLDEINNEIEITTRDPYSPPVTIPYLCKKYIASTISPPSHSLPPGDLQSLQHLIRSSADKGILRVPFEAMHILSVNTDAEATAYSDIKFMTDLKL